MSDNSDHTSYFDPPVDNYLYDSGQQTRVKILRSDDRDEVNTAPEDEEIDTLGEDHIECEIALMAPYEKRPRSKSRSSARDSSFIIKAPAANRSYSQASNRSMSVPD